MADDRRRGGWLDEYERTARLVPGLLAIAPVIVLVLAVGLRNDPLIVGLLSLISVIGVPVAIANFVRHRGNQIEGPLWTKWVGRPKLSPTVALLRIAGGTDANKETRRRDLAAAAHVELPTADEERSDPTGSDDRYHAAIRTVVTKTRDRSKFDLVFKENQSYGYWRNLLGMRVFGRTSAAASALILGVVWLIQGALKQNLGLDLLDVALGEIVIVISLAFWIWIPTEAAVKRASDAYAERLLEYAALVQ